MKDISRLAFIKGVGAIVAIDAACPAVAEDAAALPDTKLRIAHLTDPQFGFGRWPKDPVRRYAADLARMEREIEVVNAIKPDLAIITGDMVHVAADMTKDWPRLLRKFQVPIAVAPGNHDVGDSITRENLDRFISVFGSDRKVLDVKGWRIIVGNTQWWSATELAKEKAEYEEWLKAELLRAKVANGRVVVAGHIPPFADAPNEKDSWQNMPKERRFAQMEAYLDAGARFFLAGHTHRMSVRGWKELTVLNAETTSRNTDSRPFGFRLFETDASGNYSYRFVRVGA